MFDGSQNVTLEQINYEQSEQESISGISQIIYENDYNHFNDFSFNRDHLKLSKINFSPNINKYQLTFYQNQRQNTPKKIVTVSSKGKNPIKQPIKLPNKKSPLFFQIASRQNRLLRGQLSKNNGNSSVKLFDDQGKLKGNFNYTLEKMYQREEQMAPTLQLSQENTLESKDFMDEVASVRRQIEIIKNDKISIQSRATLKTQTEQSLAPKKKYLQVYQLKQQSNEDSSDSHSLKSQIDYMGYSPHDKNKVSEYKLPLSSKHAPPKTTNKTIDYHSIQKSMKRLGISNSHKIEKMLGRHRKHQNQIQRLLQQKPRLQVFPLSRHDFSSQVEQVKPKLVQFGMGTYTPIPSRQVNQRLDSPKSFKKQVYLSRKKQNQSSSSIKGQPNIIKQPLSTLLTEQYYIPQNKKSEQKQKLQDQRQVYLNTIQRQSIKQESIIKNIGITFQKQPQLSMRNKIYQFKLGQEKKQSRIRISSRLKSEEHRNQGSRKQFHTYNRSIVSQSQNESALYSEFDLCINNLSVNFHTKSFGTKYVQLSIKPNIYKTEQLGGNNLVWIGKFFLFKRVNEESQLHLTVKKVSDENVEQNMGEVRIKVSDIILNKKKSYFQTFLLNKKSVLATVIIGFQIINKSYLLPRQVYPLKIARQSQAQTEFSKNKTTKKIKRKSPKKRSGEKQYGKVEKLPEARANPIRVRKYLGGKNIKIGRASRFVNQALGIPGPGDYFLESEFSRHAQKDY